MAAELAYVLQINLRTLNVPPCGGGRLDGCFYPGPVPLWWIVLAVLLFATYASLLLRRQISIVLAVVSQFWLIILLAADVTGEVNQALFSGMSYQGVIPWYPRLLLAISLLCLVVGPALALSVTSGLRPLPLEQRRGRVAALLLGAQLTMVIVAALITFQLTFHGCDYMGPGAAMNGMLPGTCLDGADFDFTRLLAMGGPSALILFGVCLGVWSGWSLGRWAAIAWQVILGVILITCVVMLSELHGQNYWYDWFPQWLSPRYVAAALVLMGPLATLAVLIPSPPRHISPARRARPGTT